MSDEFTIELKRGKKVLATGTLAEFKLTEAGNQNANYRENLQIDDKDFKIQVNLTELLPKTEEQKKAAKKARLQKQLAALS